MNKLMKYLVVFSAFYIVSSCTNKLYILREPVKGYVYLKNMKLDSVSIRYDTVPKFCLAHGFNNLVGVTSNKEGKFIIPKETYHDSYFGKKIKSSLKSNIIFNKIGFKTKIVNLKKYKVSKNDTIDLGKIYLEKI